MTFDQIIERSFSPAVRIWATGVIAFLSTGLLLGIFARTAWSPPPLIPTDTVIFMETVPGARGAIMVELRKFVGARPESISIYRHIYEEARPNNKLILESGGVDVTVGEFTVLKTVMLPDYIAGRWCSVATIGWWPSWSQREFTQETPDVCFEVHSGE